MYDICVDKQINAKHLKTCAWAESRLPLVLEHDAQLNTRNGQLPGVSRRMCLILSPYATLLWPFRCTY